MNAAQIVAVKPLAIGDKVPDIIFSTVLNVPYTTTSLAASFDKLLLVDFWATWCGSCIKEFPKLDSLKRQFNKLDILLVSAAVGSDNPKKIKSFFEKRRNLAGDKYVLPAVFDNGMLSNLFPHSSLPHTIWIYNGKVVGITGAEEVTRTNIGNILAGKSVAFTTKTDLVGFDPRQPLFAEKNGVYFSSMLSGSVFSRYIPGAGSPTGMIVTGEGALKRRYFINMPLLRIYAEAYPALTANRLVLEDGLDSLMIARTGPDNLWKQNHYFSYEITVPVQMRNDSLQALMAMQLDAQFGFRSRIEKRTIPCFALVCRDDSIKRFINRDNAAGYGMLKDEDGNWIMHNQPLSRLINLLNKQLPARPLRPVILDETGYHGSADLILSVRDITVLPDVIKALIPYGLELIPVKRELSVLVISKNIPQQKIN